jgi:uncharacterized protein (TIGR00251 family)
MEIPFKKSRRGIILKVKVEPKSSRKGISGLLGDSLKVKVHAPPVGGAANEELIEILSKEFGIRKSDIQIVRGNSSRDKIVEIAGRETGPLILQERVYLGKEKA